MSKKTYRPKAKLEVFYTGGPLQLSPDATQLACACLQETKVGVPLNDWKRDLAVQIVDVATGAVVRTFLGDGEYVTALGFTPDGAALYVASRSLVVKKWCVRSGDCLQTLKAHTAPVSDISVDPSGSVVALGSADRTVTVHDVRGGFRTHTFKGHKGLITRVVFHPTAGELLSCSQDGTIKIWDLHQSKLRTTLKGHNSAVSAIGFSPDARWMISAGRDNTLIVWSVRNYSKVLEFPVFEAMEDVICLPTEMAQQLPSPKKATPNPCLLVACGIIHLGSCREVGDTGIDVFNRNPTEQPEAASRHEISAVQRLGQSQTFLVAKSDCSIEFLSLKGELQRGHVVSDASRFLMGNMDEITDVTFLAAKESHIAVASNSASLHLFDAHSIHPESRAFLLAALNCTGLLVGHEDAVLCLTSFAYQSRSILISGAKDQAIRIWDAECGSCLAEATGHAAAVTAIAASKRDGKWLVSVSSDKLLKVWKLKLKMGDAAVHVEKLKVVSGVVAHSKDINCVDLAPNDTLAATGSLDKTIKLFTLPNLTLQATLHGHKRGVWSVQFSPFEKTLLSSSADTTIKIWSLTDSTCLRTFEGHSGSILKALFLSQSHQVMSCGGDGLMKLWNVSSCECINTFDEHEDRIWSIAFAGEHQDCIVSGGSDSTLIIWEDTTEQDRDIEIQQKQEELSKQQTLSNAIKLRDFGQAARLAFELEHPRALLTLLKQHLPKEDHIHIFSALVELLIDEATIQKCLEYVRDWNTNARHCEEAQLLLKMILQRHPPERLSSIPGIRSVLEAIEAYSVRHFGRLQKLHQAAYVVDYMLDAMQVLTPSEESDAMEIETRRIE